MNAQQQSRELSVRLIITGRVQGVGFRQSARQQASQLGLEATAVNREDGSVLLETSGPREIVKQFIEWAEIGPELASVDDVTVINTNRYGWDII